MATFGLTYLARWQLTDGETQDATLVPFYVSLLGLSGQLLDAESNFLW